VAETTPNFLTGSWQGLLAPAGTPKAVVDLVHAEVQRITALPDVKEKLQSLGLEPSAMSSAEFAAWIKSELPEMAQVVREEKITLEN
jgi:tripartite-type tricarboxylate transporter receptor subunit TctC